MLNRTVEFNMPSKDSNDASNTVFLGSFNMNGSPLSLSHARTWLQVGIETEQSNHVSARNADLVILSLQECPTSPTPSTSPSDCFDPCIMTYNDAHYGNVDEVANVLNETLSVEHKLVADLAMGEPPSPPGKGPKHDMWYGFIRLIVYAKGGKTWSSYSSSKHFQYEAYDHLLPIHFAH